MLIFHCLLNVVVAGIFFSRARSSGSTRSTAFIGRFDASSLTSAKDATESVLVRTLAMALSSLTITFISPLADVICYTRARVHMCRLDSTRLSTPRIRVGIPMHCAQSSRVVAMARPLRMKDRHYLLARSSYVPTYAAGGGNCRMLLALARWLDGFLEHETTETNKTNNEGPLRVPHHLLATGSANRCVNFFVCCGIFRRISSMQLHV